jgi:hypothetical protein
MLLGFSCPSPLMWHNKSTFRLILTKKNKKKINVELTMPH